MVRRMSAVWQPQPQRWATTRYSATSAAVSREVGAVSMCRWIPSGRVVGKRSADAFRGFPGHLSSSSGHCQGRAEILPDVERGRADSRGAVGYPPALASLLRRASALGSPPPVHGCQPVFIAADRAVFATPPLPGPPPHRPDRSKHQPQMNASSCRLLAADCLLRSNEGGGHTGRGR